MGLGQGPPAYLAPLPRDAPKTKVHWESPRFLFLDLEVPTPTKHWTRFLCSTLLYIYYPDLPITSPSSPRDGCLLNELTLCTFDSGYWWSTSLRLTWHKGAFCSWFFCVFFLVFFLLSFVSCFLISYSKKRSTLKGRLCNSHLFFYFPLPHNFHTSTISPSGPTPQFLSPAQPPCPSAACPAADLAFVG